MQRSGSFQSILMRSSLSLLVAGLGSLTISLPAAAKNVTIRSQATVYAPASEDKQLGEFLASLQSMRSALEQALPILKEYEAFQYKGLTELDQYAMARTYLETNLNYYDKTSYWDQKRELRYRTKLVYETLHFPDKFEQVYTNDYGNILLNKYFILESNQLEQRLQAYFKRLQSSQDKNFQDLLRQQEGQILLKHYHARQLIEEATELMKLKRFEQAAESFEQALKLTPESLGLNLLAAFNQLGLEDFDQAQKILGEQINRTPDDSELYLLRGIFYLAQGIAIKAALADLNIAIEKDPKNGLAYIIQSMTLGRLNRDREAQESLDMACKVGIESVCGKKVSDLKMKIKNK